MRCSLVDVFASRPLAGNGLTVFYQPQLPDTDTMLALTREMRQFESIFLAPMSESGHYRARIFTMEEELDFAGHPILGAAAQLRWWFGCDESQYWHLHLNHSVICVSTEEKQGMQVTMQQPMAVFGQMMTAEQRSSLLQAFSLTEAHGAELPMQQVSCGLPYVIVPLQSGIEQARQCISAEAMTEILRPVGAKFAYLLDVHQAEGRTWDPAGQIEDIATGSAAGPAAAYLQRYCHYGEHIRLQQGRFLQRPSEIQVTLGQQELYVHGQVVPVADIKLHLR